MKKSYIYLALALLLFSLTPTVSKYFFKGIDAYNSSAWSLFLSALVMLIYCLVTGRLAKVRSLSRKEIAGMTATGLIGVLVYSITLQIGITYLPAQQAFIINYLWPAMIILWTFILTGERITVAKWLAVILSFIGVAVNAVNGDPSALLGGSLLGALMCVAAAVSYGFYCAMNKKMGYDSELMLLFTFIASTLICFPVMGATGSLLMPDGFVLLGYFIYGPLVTVFGFLFWLMALKGGNTALVSNMAYLTPILSLGWTHLFLHEEITIWSILGLGLILLGILLQMVLTARKETH